MSRRAMAVAGARGDLPFAPIYVGHAWSRHAKIDLVAISHKDNAVLLGECKWHWTRMGSDVLADLETRARKRRRIEGFKKHYALSRSGFTKQLERQAFEDGVALFAGPELRREPARSEPTCGGASSSTAVEGDENAFLMDKAGKWSYHRPST